jgi:hypothetical protein
VTAGVSASDPHPQLPPRGGIPRAVWHTVGLVLALLLAYAVWRGYQNPDFLLDLAAFRLC